MSEYQITLPETIYHTLLTAAQQQGVTPAAWIAYQLSATTSEEQPLPTLVSDLVGAIDSQADPRPSDQRTPFGEGIAAKLIKQGLRRP